MAGTSWGDRETIAGLRELGSSNLVVITSERCTIGRDLSNNVVISGDPCVSRFHSVITFEGGDYFISDVGSWNGSVVNGEKVFVRRKMANGDKLRVGLTRFEFVLGIDPQTAASIAAANGISHQVVSAADPGNTQTVIVRGLPDSAADSMEDTCSLPDRKARSGESQPSFQGDTTLQMRLHERLGHVDRGNASIRQPGAAGKPGSEADATLPVADAAGRQELSSPEIPEWCTRYFGPELKQLADDLSELQHLSVEIAERIHGVVERIALTQEVRDALFLKAGDESISACDKIFQLIGFSVTASGSDRRELHLAEDGKTVAIARILSSGGQTDREALTRLVVAQIDYWCQYRFEPKGLLVLTEPGIEPNFQLSDSNSDLVAYAEAKNICLIEAVQFLAIYRDIAIRQVSSDRFRKELMTTSGRLSGISLGKAASAET